MDDICKSDVVSKGELNHHVGSKDVYTELETSRYIL